ncbi:glucan biosynthesis protein [Escherichia coli]
MAAVCGTSGIASLFSQAAFAADSDIADEENPRFDFSILQSMAHDLAQTAWRGAPRPLPDTLATMTPQAYNSIQYDAEKSLWHNVENRQLDAQFFHMEMDRRRVRMFSVDPATHLACAFFTFARSCSNTTMQVLIPNNQKGKAILALPVFACLKPPNWRAVM